MHRHVLIPLIACIFVSLVEIYQSFSLSVADTSSLLTSNHVAPRANPCQEAIHDTPWIYGGPELMTREFEKGSLGLSDKYDDQHRFFYAYHPYLSKIVLRKLEHCGPPRPKLKFLEIGLGCGVGGGMKHNSAPGGSALGWDHLFRNLTDVLDFELHILEYDETCAMEWQQKHPAIAHVHTGNAVSEQDIARIVQETGSSHDFDVIIDDASHINWHQIKTLKTLIPQVQLGGIYVVEDVISSCVSWRANLGTKKSRFKTGGTSDCMTASYQNGNSTGPSFFGKVVEWQRDLARRRAPFDQVNHIDFHWSLVVFEKGLPQMETQFVRDKRRSKKGE